MPNIIRTNYGDPYGDGRVDADIDLTTFFSNYGSHTTQPDLGWSQGEFDGDGDMDVHDFFSEDFQLGQVLYRWHVVD